MMSKHVTNIVIPAVLALKLIDFRIYAVQLS
jgi:hypothetical protein